MGLMLKRNNNELVNVQLLSYWPVTRVLLISFQHF